jgi:hypothetical protein
MKKTLSSPLVAAANNIVSLGSRSSSLPKFQREYINFGKFLEVEKRSLEKLKLPDKKKIKALASLNIASNFGRPGNLLGSLFSGALDLAGFVGNMFPGRGKLGKPQRPSNVRPPKPTIRGPKLKLGGMRAVGVGNALFAGLDFATGLAKGESVGKAAAGASGALAGGLLGGAIGQALIPIPGLGFVVGNMAGSFLGGYAADRVYEGGSSLKQKLAERLKGQEGKQKGIASGLTFKDTIDKFDAAVSRFERGVARGLFGTVEQVQVNEDVASSDYVETEEDEQFQTQDETNNDYGQMGGTFESHIKEFREFRNKQFGASKERFPTPNPQLYQIRELGIWEGGKQDNWKINPLADDTAYEKDAHKGAGHWENRAFDIPVPDNSKQGDMVAEFWRKKGYRVLWKTDKAHENHVHVEIPKEKANDFFSGKLKPEDKKTNVSSDKNMMEGTAATQQMTPQQGKQNPAGTLQPQSQQQQATQVSASPQMMQVPQMSSMVAAAPMNLPVAPQNIQYYTSYNQPGGGASVIMPIMMGGGGGGQQKPVFIPVGGGGGGGTVIMPGPTEGQVVNSLMKTMLLTNFSAT